MSAVLEPTGPFRSANASDAVGSDAASGEPAARVHQMSDARSRRSRTSSTRSHSTFAQVAGLHEPDAQRELGARFDFGGVALVDCTLQEAAEAISTQARSGQALGVHMCNAFTLTIAMRDTFYRQSLQKRSLNLPDGTPVVWFKRLASRQTARGPVRGPSLMKLVLQQPDLRHYLLGGSQGVLADLERAVKTEFPDTEVVGALAPPFRDPTDDDIEDYARRIRESGAQIVWVGLGTPRQDILIAALTEQVDAVLVGVGAAFDFLAGAKREAPSYLHGTGLEWIHRFASEPGRLWRRYLICNAVFVRLAAVQLIAARRRGSAEA